MRKQRLLAALLVVTLLAGLLPSAALAAPVAGAADTSGIVGTHYSDDPDAYEIYPVPHSVRYPGGTFTMTDSVNVVVGDGVDHYTTDFLNEILVRFDRSMTTSGSVAADKTNIVLTIDDTMTESDGHYDPYTLTAQDGVITITGMDADCVYYGVATLQMMFTSFNGEKFLNVVIEDYSNTIFRGFIEGFYGGFDYEGRESQVRSIRDVKGNIYVFAAKTDPYHGGTHWADPYPEAEANQIKELIQVCDEMNVNYVWSLHIGKSGTLNNIDPSSNTDTNKQPINETLYAQQLQKVLDKFESLYDIGVRGFQILNDDYNTGTYRVQVKLLNDVNAWLKSKGDCMPLVYCCAGYNKSWAGNGAELTALQGLDEDIYLYWTGDDVNSPITQSSINWPKERSNHQVVTWLNYPCSEHSGGRGIFLGNIQHYVSASNGLTGQTGLLSNGMSSPEANKVAYFQLLSWCWNRDNYTGYLDELWEDSFKYLQPEVYGSYLTIARNVSNCPNSGRIPQGFPESEYIKDALAAVQTALLNGAALADIPEAAALMAEWDNILAAIDNFRANCANDELVRELEPWLKSLESVVTAAREAMNAANTLALGDVSGAWNAFSEGAVALSLWDVNESSNPYVDRNNKVKSGSLRIQPFAQAILDYVKEAMTQHFNPGGGLTGDEMTPMIRLGGQIRANDANAQKMFDGDPSTRADYNFDQSAGDYIGVDLGSVKLVSAIDFLQGQNDTHHDYLHKLTVEYSTDNEHWNTLVAKVNSHHIKVDDLNVAARYVRLRLLETGYGNKANFYTYVREFSVTTKGGGLLDTNVPALDADTAADGGVYTLTVPAAALSAGQYVGLKLPELVGIQTVTTAGTLPAAVTLEWSVNGESWTAGTPDETSLMGYIRLRADADTTLTDVTLTATQQVPTTLSFVKTNTGVSAGAWTNVVDGDKATLVHTNTKQAYGQYAIFDLGGAQPVRDVTVWIPESGSDIPHNLDIMVGSTDDPDGVWTTIGEVRSDSYQMDPPYRYFACDGNGTVGRYLKLAIANVEAANWFRINELEVNKTVSQDNIPTAVSSTSGNAADAADGDLLTFLIPDAAGSWQKLLQAPTIFTGVTILRGVTGASATVEAQKGDSWVTVGTLTDSATTISLADTGAITGLRISWTGNDIPSIAEVLFSGEAVPTGAAPTLYPNIYEQPTATVEGITVASGTAAGDLPLPERIAATNSGGQTVQAPVTWSCEDYDPNAAGEYTFTGVLGNATLTNPGCFTVTATVTVRPADGGSTSSGSLLPETPETNVNIWASGREVDSQGPSKALTTNENEWWSGNKMKHKGNNQVYQTITDAISWITVDLGENVSDISQVYMKFNAKVWPLDYYVQAGASTLSYADYTTPNVNTNGASTTDTSDVTFAADYAGTMHALDADGWTTIYHGTKAADTTTANPAFTIGTDGSAFTSSVPAGTRYLRIYFTKINPNALGGTGIGLKRLTVTGTRTVPPATPNITSIAAPAITGVTGDAWADLALPTHVVATMADGTTARVAVTWDDTGYDPDAAAAQTFPGTLTLPDGVTNTNNVTVSLTVTLTAPPTVAGYTLTPSWVTAVHHTDFSALPLPETAVVLFSDGSTRVLPVAWDETSYDPTRLAAQNVSGTLTLPWGNGEHTVTVQVKLTPILATQVTLNQTSLTLYANENHRDHTGHIAATVSPENASDKSVIWRTGDINVAAVDTNGTVTAMGVGSTTITATAHDGSLCSATCTVTVKALLEGTLTITKPTADADYYYNAKLAAPLNQITPQGAKDTLTYTWKRGDTVVGSEDTYYPTADDIGHAITVTVTGTDPYEGSVTSAPVTIQPAPGPAMQATPTHRNVSAEGATDGAITGLFKGRKYQYLEWDFADGQPPADAAWIDFCDDSEVETPGEGQTHGTAEITGLGEGKYVVRRAAEGPYAAGPISNTIHITARTPDMYDLTNPHNFEGGVVQARRTQIPEGDTVTLIVTPNTGYRLVDGSLKAVAADGTEIPADETATPGTYTFTMPAQAVTIAAQFELQTFTIVHDLVHIHCDLEGEHSHTVSFGDRPTITLTPDEGYVLPETLKVYTKASVDDDTTAPVEFNGYHFRLNEDGSGKGTITFTRNISEDLVVSGAGTLKTYTVDYQLTDMEAPGGSPTIAHGAAFSVNLYAAQGYYLPAAVTVTMGGQPFTDFTFARDSDTSGRLTIPAGKITGHLVITAVGADAATFGFTASPAALTGGGTVRLVAALSKSAYDAAVGDNVLLNPDPTVLVVTCDDPSIEIMPVKRDNGDYTVHYNVTLPDRTKTYTFTATLAEGVGFAAGEETCTVAVTKSPSRPSGTSTTPSTTTTTETREDGATVTTVTKPDGSKTETVQQPDGTKTEAVTTKDGDKTITVTDPEGEELAKVEIPAAIPAPETEFIDISTTPWAKEAINNVAGLKLVEGVGGNKYDPIAPMTRGALATVLHRFSQGKTDYETTFKDVAQGKYYTEGVTWAAKAGVVTGYSEEIFAPDDTITREQLAVMMARYAKLIGLDVTAKADSLNAFVDGDKTGSWAVDGVAWCVEKGILLGKGNNTLDPNAKVTRAEVAVMLDRFIGIIK